MSCPGKRSMFWTGQWGVGKPGKRNEHIRQSKDHQKTGKSMGAAPWKEANADTVVNCVARGWERLAVHHKRIQRGTATRCTKKSFFQTKSN